MDNDGKPIDMVILFMQEFMHASPHGITKKLLLEQWFSDHTEFTRGRRAIDSLRQDNIADQVPGGLQKVAGNLNYLSSLKAKNFRLLPLYCGPLVPKDVVYDGEFKHFILVHAFWRILQSRDLITKFGSYTKVSCDLLNCIHL
ncbi:hypothetical protein QAD02_013220 [Eretmocerus hayati]|uniref:Uncharacterized protein n=1 Tax=Eretmocerus hayati TaxID=131215 RepID=A0ACC2P2V4_9HYME|nr:hypothetical protein QAD02_013220 [Eretmocerus hayati]